MKHVPPTRLRDDPRAPPLARGDLSRAAQVGAGPFDVARGLAALEAAIGQAPATPPPAKPPAPTGPGPSPIGAGATSTLAGAIVKGALCGLVVVGAGGVLSTFHSAAPVATRAPAEEPSAAIMSTAPEERVVSPTSTATVPIPTHSAQPRVPTPFVASPSSETARPPDPPSLSAPPPEPAAVASPNELQLEMALLARLRALEPSDPRQALALAEEGRRRFSPGFFAQEREALAISALARLGRRDEAAARARAFIAAWPKSNFVERIRELTESR